MNVTAFNGTFVPTPIATNVTSNAPGVGAPVGIFILLMIGWFYDLGMWTVGVMCKRCGLGPKPKDE